MTHVLELWVEGSTDAALRESAEQSAQGGALPPLVRRTLHELSGKDAAVFDRLVETSVHVEWLSKRLKRPITLPRSGRHKSLSSWAKKVLIAFDQARRDDSRRLVVAIRDSDGYDARLRERDEVNNVLRDSGLHGHTTGVCVQEVEAWLLADLQSYQACFGRGPDKGVPGDPEAVREPKEVLRPLLDALGARAVGKSWTTLYHELAQQVDLSTLAKKCPQGYAKLREDLKQLVLPRLR